MEPLKFIQEKVKSRSIIWTYHVNMRMKGRSISRQQILKAVDTYEIIESYPDDKYLPSYLVFGMEQDKIMHILCACDEMQNNIRVITAYYPDKKKWKDGGKLRK